MYKRQVDELGIGFVEDEEGVLRLRFNPVEDFVAVGNRGSRVVRVDEVNQNAVFLCFSG